MKKISQSLVLVLCLGLTACGPSTLSREAQQYEKAESRTNISDSEAIAAQDAHAIKVQITMSAPVKKLLPDDTRGLPHQKFLLQLSNRTTILVANDTKYGTYVPLQPGDVVTIRGEYIWNPKGGLIHWTHRSDNPRHEGGWIMLNGKKYE